MKTDSQIYHTEYLGRTRSGRSPQRPPRSALGRPLKQLHSVAHLVCIHIDISLCCGYMRMTGEGCKQAHAHALVCQTRNVCPAA